MEDFLISYLPDRYFDDAFIRQAYCNIYILGIRRGTTIIKTMVNKLQASKDKLGSINSVFALNDGISV